MEISELIIYSFDVEVEIVNLDNCPERKKKKRKQNSLNWFSILKRILLDE